MVNLRTFNPTKEDYDGFIFGKQTREERANGFNLFLRSEFEPTPHAVWSIDREGYVLGLGLTTSDAGPALAHEVELDAETIEALGLKEGSAFQLGPKGRELEFNYMQRWPKHPDINWRKGSEEGEGWAQKLRIDENGNRTNDGTGMLLHGSPIEYTVQQVKRAPNGNFLVTYMTPIPEAFLDLGSRMYDEEKCFGEKSKAAAVRKWSQKRQQTAWERMLQELKPSIAKAKIENPGKGAGETLDFGFGKKNSIIDF